MYGFHGEWTDRIAGRTYLIFGGRAGRDGCNVGLYGNVTVQLYIYGDGDGLKRSYG